MNRSQPAREIANPQPCFVRMRLVRHGPYVAARIVRTLGFLTAEINGQPAEVDVVWTSGEFIDAEQYVILMSGPRPDPYTPVYRSDAGLAERIRKAEELDWWWARTML